MKTIIVTRHAGAADWLREHHPEFGNCEVLAHASPEDLKGNKVIGVLPIHLAALCGEYWHLTMSLPPEARGKELTAEDMEQYGCSIQRYRVEESK